MKFPSFKEVPGMMNGKINGKKLAVERTVPLLCC